MHTYTYCTHFSLSLTHTHTQGNDVEARFLTNATKLETEHIAVDIHAMTTGDHTQSITQESHENHVTQTDQSNHQEELAVGELPIGRGFIDTGVGSTGEQTIIIYIQY